MTSPRTLQFVLNTSFDPHWCQLFDDQDKLMAQAHWSVPREDGQQIWNFLATHLKPQDTLTFIGGISGPGSFSSLRTSGAVLNTLSFKFALPIHQVRADQAILDYLASINRSQAPYLLNSFGQRVFWPQADELKVIDLASDTLPTNQKFITTWLPEAKRSGLNTAENIDPLGPQKTILETLKNTQPQAQFVPDYEYPPVQT